MSPQFLKALIEKKLWVKKAGNVQGSVYIHFPDKAVADIVLNNWEPVNVFGRINISMDQIKMSNLEQLMLAGHVQIVK
jgi:hypothetical protein